jgi:hypothetical protein
LRAVLASPVEMLLPECSRAVLEAEHPRLPIMDGDRSSAAPSRIKAWTPGSSLDLAVVFLLHEGLLQGRRTPVRVKLIIRQLNTK